MFRKLERFLVLYADQGIWGEAREEAIRARYREKEKTKYGKEWKNNVVDEDVGRSSEDIWKSRDTKVEWGNAFNKPFPPQFQGSDEELNRERLRQRQGTIGS